MAARKDVLKNKLNNKESVFHQDLSPELLRRLKLNTSKVANVQNVSETQVLRNKISSKACSREGKREEEAIPLPGAYSGGKAGWWGPTSTNMKWNRKLNCWEPEDANQRIDATYENDENRSTLSNVMLSSKLAGTRKPSRNTQTIQRKPSTNESAATASAGKKQRPDLSPRSKRMLAPLQKEAARMRAQAKHKVQIQYSNLTQGTFGPNKDPLF